MNEILFAPQGLISQDYDLFRDETKVGRLTYSVFGSEDAFLIDDESFLIERENFWQRTFKVTQGSKEVLDAHVEGILNPKINVIYESGAITLKHSFVTTCEMQVWRGNSEVGRIATTGLLSRKGRSQLPDDLPLGVAGFLMRVTILSWRQNGGGAE